MTASYRFQCWGSSFSTILIAVMDIPVGTLRKLVLTSELMTYLSRERTERSYFFRIGLVHRCVRGGRFRGSLSGARVGLVSLVRRTKQTRQTEATGWTRSLPRAEKCWIARPDPVSVILVFD